MQAAVKTQRRRRKYRVSVYNVEEEDRAKVVECSMKHIQMSLCQFIV